MHNIIIDVSSLIWDESDYQANQHNYYHLVDGITYFFAKIENEKFPVLLSGNLRDQLMANFPFGKPPYYGGDFESQTLRFLSKVQTCEYPSDSIPNLISIPNIVRNYFNEEVKQEIRFLISKIHVDNESENVYFTFEYLWEGEEKLITRGDESDKEYETIISDRDKELDDFFEKIKPVFEHNPKHDKSPNKDKNAWEQSDNKLGFISQLSCYNGQDNNRPQEILDKRYPEKFGGRYIGYDIDNEVFVVFRCHKDNKYHGYDEYNDNNPEKVPPKVKEHFNK